MKFWAIKLSGVSIIFGDIWGIPLLAYKFLKPGDYWYTVPLLITLICMFLVGLFAGVYLMVKVK